RAWEVLEAVALTQAAHRRIGGYSLGMKQRLGLAAALLGRPRNIVLHEPMNGLDPQGMGWVRALLRDPAASGHRVLRPSHLGRATHAWCCRCAECAAPQPHCASDSA